MELYDVMYLHIWLLASGILVVSPRCCWWAVKGYRNVIYNITILYTTFIYNSVTHWLLESNRLVKFTDVEKGCTSHFGFWNQDCNKKAPPLLKIRHCTSRGLLVAVRKIFNKACEILSHPPLWKSCGLSYREKDCRKRHTTSVRGGRGSIFAGRSVD